MKKVVIKNATAGSNAGRGFRYQDMFGALFCVRMVTVDKEVESIGA